MTAASPSRLSEEAANFFCRARKLLEFVFIVEALFDLLIGSLLAASASSFTAFSCNCNLSIKLSLSGLFFCPILHSIDYYDREKHTVTSLLSPYNGWWLLWFLQEEIDHFVLLYSFSNNGSRTSCLLLTASCLLSTASCLLFTASCLLFTASCLLFTASWLLFIASCLLSSLLLTWMDGGGFGWEDCCGREKNKIDYQKIKRSQWMIVGY